jgi:hypothetical protein
MKIDRHTVAWNNGRHGKLRQGLAEYASRAGLPDFSLVHDTKTGKNVPNEHKMYQMVIKYPKCL